MDFYNVNKGIVTTNQDFTIQAKEKARRTKDSQLYYNLDFFLYLKKDNTINIPAPIIVIKTVGFVKIA